MMTMRLGRLIAFAAVAAVLAGCKHNPPQTPASTPLVTPPAPPRTIPTPIEPPPAPVVPPPTDPPSRQPAREVPPATPPRTPTTAPPTTPPATSGTPVLQTTADVVEAERKVRAIVASASKDLARVDYRTLGSDAKNQYDTAKRFIQQADDAVKVKNFVYAQQLAEKAAALAALLVKAPTISA